MSADRAPILQVLSWHLPYNWGKNLNLNLIKYNKHVLALVSSTTFREETTLRTSGASGRIFVSERHARKMNSVVNLYFLQNILEMINWKSIQWTIELMTAMNKKTNQMHNSLKIIKTLLYSYFAVHVSATLAPIIRSLLILYIQPPALVCHFVTDQSWKKQPTQRHTVTGGCMYRITRLLMMGARVAETCTAK
jgi:hypothetical protein